MAEAHVLSALKEKRARIAGELHAAKLRVMALQTDLGSVDNRLRLFDANLDPNDIEPKVTISRDPTWLPKGAGTRTALTILRETGDAMTSQELAACILQRYGRPIEEGPLKKLVSTLHSNFCRRKDGVVEFCRDSYPGKWRLTVGALPDHSTASD
jgi:hypothetical protein